jgi:hypothetical protein
MKLPETLGACADALFQLKADLAEQNKLVDEIKKDIQQLKNHLIANLPKSDADGVVGRLCTCRVTTKDEPQVKDWEALYAEVMATKDFSLLHRRVSAAAVKERWKDGKQVPGVDVFRVVDVSVTKR